MRIRSCILFALGLTAAGAAEAAPQSGNAFNPGIGLVLNGTWSAYPDGAGHREIPGFMLGDEAGLPPQGFGLGESERGRKSDNYKLFKELFCCYGKAFH